MKKHNPWIRDNRSVTLLLIKPPEWNEGWNAHAAGWPLYPGHTQQYVEGWTTRHKLVKESDVNSSNMG